MTTAIVKTGITTYPKHSGKVRDIYDLGDALLIVATDRISAFDCILPTPIPHKGAVLTALSLFWFEFLAEVTANHLIASDVVAVRPELKPFAEELAGRSMLVKKATVFPVECVVRGYLAGSGWKDYRKTGEVCGVYLPKGLQQAQELPEPIFTPATKAESGHDENISVKMMGKIVGRGHAQEMIDRSVEIYTRARDYAKERGIILADTKFEWGLADGELILVDEVLTPDSSRFWDGAEYRLGISPPSYDKQFVRDYLETLDWDKTPPAPELPGDIVEKTSRKYITAYEKIAGKPFLTGKGD